MAGCLTIEQLEQIAAAGSLVEQPIAVHLHRCRVCRQAFEDIQANLALFDECRDLNPVLAQRAASPNRNLQAGADQFNNRNAPEITPTVPGYDLLEEIHRGSQGIVYKAIQRNTKRTVAVKILLQGLYATRRQKRRFEREIELVAALEHSHIVRLYDSGKADGHHYFVMQYIEGLPLNQYIEQHFPGDALQPLRRFTAPRLQLFAKIVRAVAHAHHRSIIHRDLKPANILVDENGTPHVLDFGLAKPTNAVGPFDTLATLSGEFFGTLAYASPEQVSGQPDAVDTRTDVYALGVMLYELLTGHRLHNSENAITRTLANITDIDPPKPSRHDRRLGDELDSMVLKALAKQPDRRYQSADAFAEDIDRYLAGRPIHAQPDTPLYGLRKYIARHKFAAVMVVALFSTITAGLVISIVSWRQTTRQRDRAQLAETAAIEERDRAFRAEEHAALQRDDALAARSEAEQSLYFNHITLAAHAMEKEDIPHLKHLLENCPPRFRAWEWHRLHWLSDRSVLTFTGHSDEVFPVIISPEGKRVASGGRDQLIKIWDPRTGREIHTLRGHANTISNLAFSPDGSRLISLAHDKTFRLWDTISGINLLNVPHGHPGDPSIALSPDHRLVATAAWNRRPQDPPVIKLWDAQSGQLRLTIPTPASLWINVTFTPDGRRILSKHPDGNAREWDTGTGALVSGPTPFNENDPAQTGSPLGDRVIGHDPGDKIFSLVDATTNRKTRIFRGHLSPLHSRIVSPDGKFIVSGSVDATCKVWDPDAPTEALVWTEPHTIISAAFSPDGKHIATGCSGAKVNIWNAHRVNESLKQLPGHGAQINAIAYSPEGMRIVTADSNQDPGKNLVLWDVDTARQLLAFEGHPDGVPAVAFSPDGRRVISGGWDATLRIWDAQTGQAVHVLKQDGEVWDLAVSPDGQFVASGGKDLYLYLWDLESGRQQWRRKGHTLEIDALAFSPDSKTVVSGANDGRLILRNVSDAKTIWETDTKLSRIYDAVFTRDGKRIITCHDESKINVWDVATGIIVYAWNAHTGGTNTVYALDLSPDGRSLLSAGENGTFILWPTSPAQ